MSGTFRFAFSLATPLLATLALVLTGCDCGGTPPGDACTNSRDCETNESCVDGECIPRSAIDGDVPGEDGGGLPVCVDFDGDGLGTDCTGGPDCDDGDANRGGPERCDSVDNDCDGTVDEGLDICSSCTPACEVDMFPGAGGWMPTDENSEGVIVDEGGALTLGRSMSMAFSVWVANTADGTVSRLRFDETTGAIVETGRYPSVGAGAPAGTRPWNEGCNSSSLGNCPSRSAVDQNFDAYVANRAFGNQGSLTKYANDEADCIDRNGSGVIDTSRDLNGDGVINIDPVGIGQELVGPEDECILWTVAVGPNNGWPRALAIGVAAPDAIVGDVWVGLFAAQQACRINPMDGSTIACVPINGLQPYGAASDAMGRIWMVDRTGGRRDVLGYVDPITMNFTSASPVPAFECPTNGELQPYGLTVDGEGHVFVVNSVCAAQVLRYDSATDVWDHVLVPGNGTPRGVAADETNLWVGLSHDGPTFTGGLSNRLIQFRLADLSYVATHNLPTGVGTVGVGVSFDGSVWAIAQGSNLAARLNPAAGTWTEHGVGQTPYTYSDFIGFGLNVFAQPRGSYRFVVEGCEGGEFGGQTWLGARVRAEIPAGTEVTLWARTANEVADLAAMPFVGPFPTPVADLRVAPGPLAAGRYIEVELRLRTDDRRVAPRIMGVDLAGECTSAAP